MLPNKDEESFLLLYEMQMLRTWMVYISQKQARLLLFVEKERKGLGGF